MQPTNDFLQAADKHIRKTLLELRPKLLEAQGAIEHKLKDDKSVVTEMDVMVENRLKESLYQLDAGIGFGGEETGVDYSQKTFWLVDPIDGTESFIRGMPFCTNMIALIHEGEPIMGTIYNFTLDEYYKAVKDQGATFNGHVIHVSTRPLKRAIVVSGPSHGAQELRSMTSGIVKMKASGYEFSLVARGAIEGVAAKSAKVGPWDYAPGALIIQEAGGRVANIGHDTYDYRKTDLVASNAVIFDELMNFMSDNQ